MNNFKKYLCIGLLTSISLIKTDPNNDLNCKNLVKTIFKPISQGSNLYTQYHKPFLNEDDDSCFDFGLDINYRFQQTKNDCDIAKHLYQYNILKIQGNTAYSPMVGIHQKDSLVANYFGLGQDSNEALLLEPKIKNHIIDLQLKGEWNKFWGQANLPLVHSKWEVTKYNNNIGKSNYEVLQINASAGITTESESGNYVITDKFGDSFVADSAKSLNELLFSPNGANLDGYSEYNDSNNFTNTELGVGNITIPLINGDNVIQTLTNSWDNVFDDPKDKMLIKLDEVIPLKSLDIALSGNIPFGNNPGRKYNNFDLNNCESKNKWKLADIHLQFGYDFLQCEKKHLGIYAKIIIPTGTKIDDEYFNYTFSPIIGNGRHFELGGGLSGHYKLWENEDSTFSTRIDGYLTHMFKKSQFRLFDKDQQPMSRYSVLKKLKYSPDTSNTFGFGGSDYDFDGTLKILGDINNGEFDVSVAVRGEALIDFVYNCQNWETGAGYAFSGQSKEKLDNCDSNCNETKDIDTYFYGYKGDASMASIRFYMNPADADDDKVFICNNNRKDGSIIQIKSNSLVTSGGNSGAYDDGTNGFSDNEKDVFKLPDINNSGIMNGQALHRIFGHINYVWSDCQWMPKIGIMGSLGLTNNKYKTAEYWDIGASFGLSF